MAGAISTLLNAGFDSFTNLYDIIIQWPASTLAGPSPSQGMMAVRAKDFQYVPLKVGLYPVHYKTVSISRPGAKFEGERGFSLTFRGDSAYDILNKFHAWKHLYTDPSGESHITFGSMSGDVFADENAALYGKVAVRAYKTPAGTQSDALSPIVANIEPSYVGAEYLFEQVMAIDIQEPTFTREGSQAVEFTVAFIYGRMGEPGGNRDDMVAATFTA